MFVSSVIIKNSVRSTKTTTMDLYVLKRKSENMNLKFKSSEPDLKFNIQSQLKIINANLLYLTRETDDIKRILNRYVNDTKLQKSVDEYFEDPPQEEDKEPN